ncbi:hypothetical protein PGB90_007049 [Kerria lacca]
MDQCYGDIDVDQSDLDLSGSSSSLPFDFMECNKSPMSPTHVAMFYPQLGYDFHPLLMNQRKKSDCEKPDTQSLLTNDDFQLPTHHLVISPPKVKSKQKTTKYIKKRSETIFNTTALPQSSQLDTSTDSVEKNRKIFFCHDCGKSFKFQTSLLRHNNKVHNCKYQCPTCHRVFSRQAYLDVHISKPGSSCFLNCFSNLRTQTLKQSKI